MFSERSGLCRTPNRLAAAIAARRARGEVLVDLTVSNPPEVGLGPDADALRAALAGPGVDRYRPEPAGGRHAREAVAAYYAGRGRAVDPADVVLTASTSEAYALLFRLLCDPGDRVVAPRPGYPLIEHLARFDGLRAGCYPVSREGARWRVDTGALAREAASARAVIAVHPGNPTGAFLSAGEWTETARACAAAGAALIVDEVFSDYAIERVSDGPATVAGEPARGADPADIDEPLRFVASGLSKVLGLPQVKLGWIVAGGQPAARREAVARLEVIADAYLSVSASAQAAAIDLLPRRGPIQAAILERVRGNRAALAAALGPGSPARLLSAEGGWSAAIELPATRTDEEWAVGLVGDAGVIAHPGYLFDFDREGHLVVSLLAPPDAFREGVARLAGYVRGWPPPDVRGIGGRRGAPPGSNPC